MDADKFAKYGKRYRSAYLDAAKALYTGEPVKTQYKPKVKRKRNHIEDSLQMSIVEWLRNLGYLVASIPNHGKRSAWEGQKQVTMGLLAGAADLFIIETNKGYHGWFMELKSPGKKPTESQLKFGELVKVRGYYWSWHDQFDDAKAMIEWYFNK